MRRRTPDSRLRAKMAGPMISQLEPDPLLPLMITCLADRLVDLDKIIREIGIDRTRIERLASGLGAKDLLERDQHHSGAGPTKG